MKAPKEVITEYVKVEGFKSTGDIKERLKQLFADVVNEVLQCEIEDEIPENTMKAH